MLIKSFDKTNKTLTVSIPLTTGTAKTRIKKRSFFNDYGVPVSTKSEPFNQNCYVEWQIGYDVVTDDEEKLALTTLKDYLFQGANGKEKTLYELSEYLFYFYKWGVISRVKLLEIKSFLASLTEHNFIDSSGDFPIERTHPIQRSVSGIDFSFTQVKYPMLIHKFGTYEILTEIKITEKQRAIGVQPMLYFCFPITELHSANSLLGRTASTKEMADFIIDSKNIYIFLEMFKIFGILSKNHNHDIKAIIDKILS